MTPLPKNSEGYPDPTAENAIRKVDKDMNTTNEFYPGDIWRCKRNDGKGPDDLYVIFAVHDKYATTMKLYDTPSYSNNLEVKAEGIMYADCGRLSWVFLDTCKDFIRCMNPKELETLRNSVAKALNITLVSIPDPVPTKTTVAEVVVGPDPELKLLIEKLNRVELAVLDNKAMDDLTEQNIRLSAQLEVYKGLYEKVLTGKFSV